VGAVTEVDDDVQRAVASARKAAAAAEYHRFRRCIGSTGVDLMHGARQNAYAIFATARSSCPPCRVTCAMPKSASS
jgi:hypothetical protein